MLENELERKYRIPHNLLQNTKYVRTYILQNPNNQLTPNMHKN